MPFKTRKKGSKTCVKWGNKGKEYCSNDPKKAKAKSARQMRAIRASGYKGK